MATRNDDLGTANAVFHRDHVGAEPVADIVIFDDHPFALGHDGLKFPKVENDVGAIETTHRSADDFASARISPVFGLISMRRSRDAPTLFFEAESSAFETASSRISRLIPRSRSR